MAGVLCAICVCTWICFIARATGSRFEQGRGLRYRVRGRVLVLGVGVQLSGVRDQPRPLSVVSLSTHSPPSW